MSLDVVEVTDTDAMMVQIQDTLGEVYQKGPKDDWPYDESQPIGWSCRWANEVGWSRSGNLVGRASPETGRGERTKEAARKGVNVYGLGGVVTQVMKLLTAKSASLVSFMRGSGGYLNSLRPGVGVHVEDRKGGLTGCKSGWSSFRKVRYASPNTLFSCG